MNLYGSIYRSLNLLNELKNNFTKKKISDFGKKIAKSQNKRQTEWFAQACNESFIQH